MKQIHKIIKLSIFVFILLNSMSSFSQKSFTHLTSEQEESAIKEINNSGLTADSLIKLIKSQIYPSASKKGLMDFDNLCIDGVSRSFSVYIPENYDSKKATPLFVYLHGGVGTKELVDDSTWLLYLNELPWMKLAEEQNYICLFPKGQYSAMWWDTVGAANILQQIRFMKSNYNIDDNKVYLNGFSDGASANYFMAMSHPTDFACFNSYNGFPAVGGFTKATPTYFVNLQNCNLHAINTDIDGLYPARKMQPMIALAQEAGANILYRTYTGVGHRLTYINKELPKAVDYLNQHPRNAFPTRIVMETVSPAQGRYNWLEIDATDTLQEKKNWQLTYNMKTVDDRLSFGFRSDRDYEKEGIRIDKVMGGICEQMGLHDGDVFVQLDTMKMKDIQDMRRYKKTAKRGDSVRVIIDRNDTILTFDTKFPDLEYYDIFTYKKASGQIRGTYVGNTFKIETSRIKQFSIYIHPDMVQLDQKVKVILNGKEIFNDFVKSDNEFILRNYFRNKDKALLYVNKLTFPVQ